MKRHEPDAIDSKLLEELQADARSPVALIAERVGISAPACYRRIRRLHKNGLIQRDVAVVPHRVMGWPLSMIVLVTLEREQAEIVERLVARLSASRQVVEAWFVTGDHDFVLRIVARDMEDFDELTRELLVSQEAVRSFKTLVVMRHTKPASPVPSRHLLDI